jgi:hypothetical protein
MADNFGWAYIEGASVSGTDTGLMVKVSGTSTTSYSELVWNNTTKKLTVTGTAATATALAVTGKVEANNATISSDLTVTNDVAVGASARSFANASFFRGNCLTIRSTEVIPQDYRGLAYGPLSVADDAALIIGTDAILAIEPEANLPAVLS